METMKRVEFLQDVELRLLILRCPTRRPNAFFVQKAIKEEREKAVVWPKNVEM